MYFVSCQSEPCCSDETSFTHSRWFPIPSSLVRFILASFEAATELPTQLQLKKNLSSRDYRWFMTSIASVKLLCHADRCKIKIPIHTPINNIYKGPHFHRWHVKAWNFLTPCLAVTRGSKSIGSSSIFALSNNPSRPVGFSGTKNCWGLNQGASLSAFPEASPDVVGVQSISSPLFALFTGVEPCKDGTPNTGLACVIIGFEERESNASTSCSGRVGKFVVVGVLEREPRLGVTEIEESNLRVWVSIRRITGGCSVRRTKKETTMVLTKIWLSSY